MQCRRMWFLTKQIGGQRYPVSVAENPFRCRIQRLSRADAQRHDQGSDGEDTLMQAAVVRDKTRGSPSLTGSAISVIRVYLMR
jgi:hypothetical protein